MMFPHKMTVFNRIQDEENGERVQRTVLKNVLFMTQNGTGRNSYGLNDADTVTVYIPRSVNADGSKFIDPFEFEKLGDSEASGYYTFKKGDYIAFGDVVLTGTPDEFKNETGNLYEVTAFKNYNYGRLQHIKVVAQ